MSHVWFIPQREFSLPKVAHWVLYIGEKPLMSSIKKVPHLKWECWGRFGPKAFNHPLYQIRLFSWLYKVMKLYIYICISYDVGNFHYMVLMVFRTYSHILTINLHVPWYLIRKVHWIRTRSPLYIQKLMIKRPGMDPKSKLPRIYLPNRGYIVMNLV